MKEKMIGFWTKNKGTIKKIGIPVLIGIGVAAIFIAGEKYDEYISSLGYCKLNKLGYIKYFDPKGDGTELPIEKAVEVITRDSKEIKDAVVA